MELLIDYIAQCKGDISMKQAVVDEVNKRLALPTGFSLRTMGLDTRAYNILDTYYRSSRGERDILNTYKKELRQMRNCGKKTIDQIEAIFSNYGVVLL